MVMQFTVFVFLCIAVAGRANVIKVVQRLIHHNYEKFVNM